MSKFLYYIKHNVIVLVCCFMIIFLGTEQFRHERAIKATIDNLDWRIALTSYDEGNTISTEVGVIQFLKRGYSIHIESVEYTQAGLVLTGHIGNPTNIWLTSLTLNFRATRPLYSAREAYLKKKFRFFFGPEEIGKAQTFVGTVPPGQTTSFRVTIPNVKQTSERIELVVDFSGERYSYLR